MKTAIVGYSGFVGQNLCLSHSFDARYRSSDISLSYGTRPDLLVYAGVRSEMFTANHFPEKDMENIRAAAENIRRIAPGKLVLISTISVYPEFEGDENTPVDSAEGSVYGRNRRYLERWVEENVPGSLIVRLPALYGEGIKKNFIFDMINFIPALLREDKYRQLMPGSGLEGLYEDRGDGFRKCVAQTPDERRRLRVFFEEAGFSALNFTDSRSEYQYFNLANLWDIIQTALENDLRLLTIATEPIRSSELYEYIFEKPFVNECAAAYPVEHLKSRHAGLFGGRDGYLYGKDQLLEDIKLFVERHTEHV